MWLYTNIKPQSSAPINHTDNFWELAYYWRNTNQTRAPVFEGSYGEMEVLEPLETQHSSLTEIPYSFLASSQTMLWPQSSAECWSTKPVFDENTKETSYLLVATAFIFGRRLLDSHLCQRCWGCTLRQIWPPISASRWPLPLRFKTKRRGRAVHAQSPAWVLLSSAARGFSPVVSRTWVFWFKPFLRKPAFSGRWYFGWEALLCCNSWV